MNLSTSIGVEQVLPLITVSLISTKKLTKPLPDLYGRFPLDYLHFSLSILYILPSSVSLHLVSFSLDFSFFLLSFSPKAFPPFFPFPVSPE